MERKATIYAILIGIVAGLLIIFNTAYRCFAGTEEIAELCEEALSASRRPEVLGPIQAQCALVYAKLAEIEQRETQIEQKEVELQTLSEILSELVKIRQKMYCRTYTPTITYKPQRRFTW